MLLPGCGLLALSCVSVEIQGRSFSLAGGLCRAWGGLRGAAVLVWRTGGTSGFGARPQKGAVEFRHHHAPRLVVDRALRLSLDSVDEQRFARNEVEITARRGIVPVAALLRA